MTELKGKKIRKPVIGLAVAAVVVIAGASVYAVSGGAGGSGSGISVDEAKRIALEKVEGTDMTYAEYVGAHSKEWTNIMTNLGFYWADNSQAPAEPDWDNLDWATLTQAAE